MLAPEILELLRCPDSSQRLHLAESGLIERLNRAVVSGEARDRANQIVKSQLEAGLVREDGTLLYPVRNGIPVLLLEAAIPL